MSLSPVAVALPSRREVRAVALRQMTVRAAPSARHAAGGVAPAMLAAFQLLARQQEVAVPALVRLLPAVAHLG